MTTPQEANGFIPEFEHQYESPAKARRLAEIESWARQLLASRQSDVTWIINRLRSTEEALCAAICKMRSLADPLWRSTPESREETKRIANELIDESEIEFDDVLRRVWEKDHD